MEKIEVMFQTTNQSFQDLPCLLNGIVGAFLHLPLHLLRLGDRNLNVELVKLTNNFILEYLRSKNKLDHLTGQVH